MFKIILVATFLALAIPQILGSKEELEQQMLANFKACKLDYGLADDVEAKWMQGDKSVVDDDLKCAALCIFTKAGIMDDTGNVIHDKLKALVAADPQNIDRYMACAKAATKGNNCEKGYDFLECTFKICHG